MTDKVEYLGDSEGENEEMTMEVLEPEENFDEESVDLENPKIVAVGRKSGTVVLKPGTLTLPKMKKKLVPIHDKQRVRELLSKYKSLGNVRSSTSPIEQKPNIPPLNNVEVLHEDESSLDETRNTLTSTSLQDRFLHRKRIMTQKGEIVHPENSNKRIKVIHDVTLHDDRPHIYWDTDKDMQKADPTMFDTELLQLTIKNQMILDTKLNLIYDALTSPGVSVSRKNVITVKNTELTHIDRSDPNTFHVINFSQIPIRNNEEFLSLEEELKENPESIVNFELLLENLGTPENYSELIKQITGKLFTPNFMEQLGWSQVGTGGLHLKETCMKESIYNVFAKKYEGIQEDILNDKFSQHFRSFRNQRNKSRLKQKLKQEFNELSS